MDASTTLSERQAALFAMFDRLDIPHQTHRHAPVFTVEEGAEIKARLPGVHTKNLFLKDKSGQVVLIPAAGDTQIPLNQIHKAIGTKRLSFGKPDLLMDVLGVTPGSVTVFALIYDAERRCKLVLDERLFAGELVNFHPLSNDATTAIPSDRLEDFIRACGHTPERMDFSALLTG